MIQIETIATENFTYRSIQSPSEGIFRDRGSKFYAYAYPVSSRDEITTILNKLREDHPKSRHHCYSFRLGGQGQDYRIADDGEPAGSAGQPIYHQLLSQELTQILVVVIRYFGGTKLGIPGLINAYKTAACEALNQATINTHTLSASYLITTTYDHAAQLMNAFQNMNFEVEHVDYQEQVTFSIKVPKEYHRDKVDLAVTKGMNLPAVAMLAELDPTTLEIKLTQVES